MNNENLWAPWRLAYIRELKRRLDAAGPGDEEPGDFLARYWNEPERDEANHVVHRGEHGMVLLNRYPYSNGHLLVALGDPRPTLLDYEPPARAAFWSLVESAMALKQRALAPQGVNLGMNQGRASGAGVPEHLHAHLVPRWSGDTNFITVTGGVRVIPDALDAVMGEYLRAREELGL
jgi:ATP adenylyltransferase